MSLIEKWDNELHRAESVLERDTRRFGHLVLLPEEEPNAQDVETSEASEEPPT